jgi:uncharacterized protein YkwD
VRSRGSICIVAATAAVLAGVAISKAHGPPSVEAASVRDAEGCPHSGAVPTPEQLAETRTAILCLLNRERARHGLTALQSSRLLQLASQRHSDDMAERNYFEHDTPEGLDSAARIVSVGYPRVGMWFGENLYWGEETKATPVKAVEGWMHSPGHRANILRPEFAEVGVGVAHDAPIPVSRLRAAVYTTDFGGVSR